VNLKRPSLASGPIRSLTSWYAKVLHGLGLTNVRVVNVWRIFAKKCESKKLLKFLLSKLILKLTPGVTFFQEKLDHLILFCKNGLAFFVNNKLKLIPDLRQG